MSRTDMVRYLSALFCKTGRRPLYITYFLTNKCNLFCEHCFYATHINQPENELNLDEIRQLTQSPDNLPVLLYSGGESFMRGDLAEITQAFYSNSNIRYLSIPTNGTLLKRTEEMTVKICESCPDLKVVLNFSVDLLEEEHNRIRGGKDTSKIALGAAKLKLKKVLFRKE